MGYVQEDFTVAVTTLSHENAEDIKILGLDEAFRWENRLGSTKIAPTNCGILRVRERFVERREKARLVEDGHDRFRDIGDYLFVGVQKIAR